GGSGGTGGCGCVDALARASLGGRAGAVAAGRAGATARALAGALRTAAATRDAGTRAALCLTLGAGARALALVDPDLHADPAEGGLGLVEAVVDVGPQRVQRD